MNTVWLDADGQDIPANPRFVDASKAWLADSVAERYSYRFTWLGRPIIQYPQDILAVQELIWRTRPDLIIETGVAHGGSIVLSASILELIGGRGRVIGIDNALRPANRCAIESHPLAHRILLVDGSSTDKAVVEQVAAIARSCTRVMAILDSSHTHEHVRNELRDYSPLVTPGNYLVVMDTGIEDLPDDWFKDRPWGKGNNPMTAVQEFLSQSPRFVVDRALENKLAITGSPGGYLLCIGERP
jgi:cephalosporin hydroxylase